VIYLDTIHKNIEKSEIIGNNPPNFVNAYLYLLRRQDIYFLILNFVHRWH